LTAIDGVEIVQLEVFEDERGAVFRMLRNTDPHFVRFGEIYFSSVRPGVVKAWKSHTRLTSNYACVQGRIKFVLWDDREGSTTRGAQTEILISPDEYRLIVVPPGVWHGFQGLAEPLSLLANCATEPNDPSELHRLEPHSKAIPYDWSYR
jgi:dTDP-4-dehydrorhamnose 3,5-epimerase